VVVVSGVACSPAAGSSPTPTPTTNTMLIDIPTPTPILDRCDGLSGELELQILVGPSEAVGLEPVAIGNIPFTVSSGGGANIVNGGGPVSYQEVLEEEWGTYTVEMDLESVISGECVGEEAGGELNLVIEMSGEQMVEVRAGGFQGDYPWAGSHELHQSFPIEEGATGQGEGWAVILHVNE
jgi:hypothetical protein